MKNKERGFFCERDYKNGIFVLLKIQNKIRKQKTKKTPAKGQACQLTISESPSSSLSSDFFDPGIKFFTNCMGAISISVIIL